VRCRVRACRCRHTSALSAVRLSAVACTPTRACQTRECRGAVSAARESARRCWGAGVPNPNRNRQLPTAMSIPCRAAACTTIPRVRRGSRTSGPASRGAGRAGPATGPPGPGLQPRDVLAVHIRNRINPYSSVAPRSSLCMAAVVSDAVLHARYGSWRTQARVREEEPRRCSLEPGCAGEWRNVSPVSSQRGEEFKLTKCPVKR